MRHFMMIQRINEQQILDNAAMFQARPNSIPSFAEITTGQVSVSDNLAGSLGLNNLFRTGNTTNFTPSVSRSWGHTWNTKPVTSTPQIEGLRSLYKSLAAKDPEHINEFLRLVVNQVQQQINVLETPADSDGPATIERKLLTLDRLNATKVQTLVLFQMLNLTGPERNLLESSDEKSFALIEAEEAQGLFAWSTTNFREVMPNSPNGIFGNTKLYIRAGNQEGFSNFVLFNLRLMAMLEEIDSVAGSPSSQAVPPTVAPAVGF